MYLKRITAQIRYGFEVIHYTPLKTGVKGLVISPFKIIWHKMFGSTQLLFVKEPSVSESPPPIEVPNYRIVSITSADMINKTLREQFVQYQHYFFRNPETMFSKGAHLWLGYLNGQFAHIAYTRSGDRVGSFFLPITPECILIEDCVTLPKYRGHRLYPATLIHIVRTLRNKGFKTFYIYCSDWNVPSAQAILRAGFHLIGRGRYKKRGHIVWLQESTDFAQHHRREEKVRSLVIS
jgi:hypothetical protein